MLYKYRPALPLVLFIITTASIPMALADNEMGHSPIESNIELENNIELADNNILHNQLEVITVTGTREAATIGNTAASIGVLSQETVDDVNATHSADLLNRIPGVNVNQLGSSGQGTSAAIRQPITTSPVYLYLENGVPTRSPAFFNHNALYEVNVAEANSVEVTKGPGSALYGSDAIGGVINVITNAPITSDTTQLTLEGGDDDWKRAQLKTSHAGDDHRLAARLDVIDDIGWRKNNDFTRNSANLIWQTDATGFNVNTVYSGTWLDMKTGGSGLSWADYNNNPEKAGNLIGYRDVSSQRLSSAWHTQLESGELTLTPYLRHNRLEYIATWALNTGRVRNGTLDSKDAHINDSGDDSLGTQIKYKQNIVGLQNAFWISGIDLDYSQGTTQQTYIERTDTDTGNYWLAYRPAGLIYDYKTNFTSASPYFHIESDIDDHWRVNAGLRYDNIRYGYDNKLTTDLTDPIHKRPADTDISLNHFSPKLGVIYKFNSQLNAYAAYRHGFRIPSDSQLFRAGSTVDSTHLDPVKANSYETGLRGQLNKRIDFEVTVYTMNKKDDIISITDETGARRNVNAGNTTHKGVEAGMNFLLAKDVNLGVAYTRSKHIFDDWTDGKIDYSGKTNPSAPRSYSNVRLAYSPQWLNGGRFEAEWIHQGQNYIDQANLLTYDGYDLLNLRASYQVTIETQVYVNLYNAEDKLWAESTSSFGAVNAPIASYTPGKPRTLNAGIKINF